MRQMLEEVSEMIGLQVYTNGGIFLGNVGNVIVDVAASNIDGLFVTDTNPLLVEDSKSVAVPYRWIQSIGDIVILGYFPKRVALRKPAPEQKPEENKVLPG
ncbi:MAG: photosystem reaction center subunit H [Euryarchaeota archaeon]|nr:photosystem reaction center subunit H [Euryarchaeota archaeon]